MRKYIYAAVLALLGGLGLAVPAAAGEDQIPSNGEVDAFDLPGATCDLVEVKFVNMTESEVYGQVRIDGDDLNTEIFTVPAEDELVWHTSFDEGSGKHEVEFRVWGYLDWGNRYPVEVDCGNGLDDVGDIDDDDSDDTGSEFPDPDPDDDGVVLASGDGDLPKTGGINPLVPTLAGLGLTGLGTGAVWLRRRMTA